MDLENYRKLEMFPYLHFIFLYLHFYSFYTNSFLYNNTQEQQLVNLFRRLI